MTDYSFILDNMRWSFSSVSTFETCPYAFKLTYINSENRINNFYSDFGLLVHDVLEKFFKGKIQIYEMRKYYEENWDTFIVSPPPKYPENMVEKYYETGLEYFSNFDFDLSLYDIIGIEESVKAEYDEVELTTRPDLILKEKATGKYILIDFKTSKYKKRTKKQEKSNTETEQMEGYLHQFYLYTYFYWAEKDIKIDEIKIWFIRDGIEIIREVDPVEVQKTMDWFTGTIEKIKNEKEWRPNISSKNKYFCNILCGVRASCPYNV